MEEQLKKDRAWIEVNLENLAYNIEQIKNIIPNKAKIMAVVKANAYGHGMIEVAKKLNKIGIQDFAVATLEEAIELRKNGIGSNILILGYTNFSSIPNVIKYDLIQTIVDFEYAEKIRKMNLDKKVKVHIKINTGMNRIGESTKNIENLVKIYKNEKIDILGTYSHLCVSDSLKNEDVEFTKKQIEEFFYAKEKLEQLGFNLGKIHLQASYGILNYSYLECDYVRPGIIMYGVYSQEQEKILKNISLKPVLQLKARVTSVKYVEKGETISYGRIYKADTKRKIATVCIGYADGYPRNVSGKNAKVLVNGKYATIVGRICMDQLMIDVTDIENIEQADIVTLIGNKKDITIERLAMISNTITNEILSRFNKRLPIVVEKAKEMCYNNEK